MKKNHHQAEKKEACTTVYIKGHHSKTEQYSPLNLQGQWDLHETVGDEAGYMLTPALDLYLVYLLDPTGLLSQ